MGFNINKHEICPVLHALTPYLHTMSSANFWELAAVAAGVAEGLL